MIRTWTKWIKEYKLRKDAGVAANYIIDHSGDFAEHCHKKEYRKLSEHILDMSEWIVGHPIKGRNRKERHITALIVISDAGLNAAKDYKSGNFPELMRDVVQLAKDMKEVMKK